MFTLVAVASPLLTIGAAWGGVKVGLNGTRTAVTRIEKKLDTIERVTNANATDIAVQRATCAQIHANDG